MSKSNHWVQKIGCSPFVWGVAGAAGFYAALAAIPQSVTQLDMVRRYFTHHPVEYMETVLFAVGLAVLIGKILEIASQRGGLAESLLGPTPTTPQSTEDCNILLRKLDELPERRQEHYYVGRLRAALEYVKQHGSGEGLDDELKYLADSDAGRSHADFGLFRVIVWAIPILGFLGTVIGITMALNSVDLKEPDKSMLQVLNGLGLKFDTTALALSLSMVLMFIDYYVERAENALLDRVDNQTQEDLAGRFAVVPADADGQFLAMRRIAEAMMQTTEALVKRQAELWQTSVDMAAQHWAKMSETAAAQVQNAMTSASSDLARQAEMLQKAIEAAADVAKLEDSLNRNLSALASSKHFEQTVLSLAAAVNMLSAQLTDTHEPDQVRLQSSRRASHAA